MRWWEDLGARIEKSVGFHFHVHLSFNLAEFIASMKDDVQSIFGDINPSHFMSEPDVCDNCGIALDLADSTTLSVEVEDEDGDSREIFFHQSCATPEMIAEADAEDDDADD
jgi:hypothetical protein